MGAFAQLTRLVLELTRTKRGSRLLRLEFGTQAVDLLLEQVALKPGLLYTLALRRRSGGLCGLAVCNRLAGDTTALDRSVPFIRSGPPLGNTVINKRGDPSLVIRALRTRGSLSLGCSATSRSNLPISPSTRAFCMHVNPSSGHAAVHDFPLGCNLPG